MSKRERILAIIIGGLVALFLLDMFLVQPTRAYFDDVSTRIERADEQLTAAQLLVDNRALIAERWDAYEKAGVGDSESALRIKVQQGLTTAARQTRFNLATLNSGRTSPGESFNEVQFIASGNGSIAAVVNFLTQVHSSEFPLRIESLEITSRSEKDDNLTLRLTLSTINDRPTGDTSAGRAGGTR